MFQASNAVTRARFSPAKSSADLVRSAWQKLFERIAGLPVIAGPLRPGLAIIVRRIDQIIGARFRVHVAGAELRVVCAGEIGIAAIPGLAALRNSGLRRFGVNLGVTAT